MMFGASTVELEVGIAVVAFAAGCPMLATTLERKSVAASLSLRHPMRRMLELRMVLQGYI